MNFQFPLVSKCGHIRKLVSESTDAELATVELPNCPGGAEAFELAAMFCYGINFEIGTENIAMLRCAAEYLEMTEEYAVGNLVGRTEAYINEVALKSLAGAVSVLHMSQSLLPTAEKVKLVSRCIDAIAFVACKDSHFSMLGRASDIGHHNKGLPSKPIVDWWAEDLTVLRIDIFQRVLVAMMSRGYKHYSLGPVLMLYAQKSLRGLVRFCYEYEWINKDVFYSFLFLFFLVFLSKQNLCSRRCLGRGGRKLSHNKSMRRE